MKKTVFLFCFLLGLSDIAFCEKVYPKVMGNKGLAPTLYLPDNPTPAVIKINEAKQAYFEERYADSCELWQEALNLKPFHPEGIWHDIALCNKMQCKYPQAIEAITQAINIKQQSDFYLFRGEIYLKMNDAQQALKDFKTYFIKENKNPDLSYRMMARMCIEEQRFEQALYFVEQGMQILSGLDRLALICTKANALAALGQVDKGIEVMEKHEVEFKKLKNTEEENKIRKYYTKVVLILYDQKLKKHLEQNDDKEVLTVLKKMNAVVPNDKKIKKAMCAFMGKLKDMDYLTVCHETSFFYRLGNFLRKE